MKTISVQHQNKYPTFQAIKFENGKVQKDFISVLKKQPFEDFNEALNIVKAQSDNFVDATIDKKYKNDKYNTGLNFSAIIYDELVDAGESLLGFLQKIARKADNYKFSYYHSKIKNNEITEELAKEELYQRTIETIEDSSKKLPKIGNYNLEIIIPPTLH